jgi:hypothetical protein
MVPSLAGPHNRARNRLVRELLPARAFKTGQVAGAPCIVGQHAGPVGAGLRLPGEGRQVGR